MTAPEPSAAARSRCGQVQARGRIRAVAGLLGPASVASVAYADPGNLPDETV